MRLNNSRALKALALFLVFSLTQLYVHTTLAGPSVLKKTDSASSTAEPQAAGRLVTRGNQSVLVNGTNASTGATILTGATIETGDGVGATINLGPLGSVDLAPNTRVTIEYSDGQVRLRLLQGCVIVRNKKGTQAEVSTEQGTATNSNGSTAGLLDVCFPQGAPNPIVNQGAAANAGAGVGGGPSAAAGGGAGGAGGGGGEWGLFGLGTPGTIALLAGIGAAIIVPVALHRGRNPSPGTPRGAP